MRLYTFHKNSPITSAMFGLLFSISVVFASGTLYNFQDFDNPTFPPAGWTLQNTTGNNVSRTTYCSGYGNGLSSVVFDFYDYASGNFEMISSTLPVSTSGDSLVFDHAYASAPGSYNDRLDVYTSSNNGSSWNLLISLVGGTSGPLVTGTATWDLFVPTSGQWATKRYSLPVGTNKVKFTGVTQFGNNLYLDNVKIGVPFTNDVGVSGISEPKWGITTGNQTPKAYVRNFGTAPQTFTVTLTINPGGYSNMQNVTNLAPGASQLVTFTNNNFTTTGNYTLTATTTLGSDQNASNNSITNNLVVTTSPREVVLEFCTGTWCQWCPCGDDEAHHLDVTYPNNSVLFAYHGGSDPWQSFNGNTIIGLLGFSGYPSGLVDRRLGANNGWGSFFFDAEYRLGNSSGAPISITPTSINYNQGTRVLTVNMNSVALTNLTGQYKVNYTITEDNLVYAQTGNSWCPGNPNAVHKWVVRSIVNTVTGENVNSGGVWNNGQSYPLTFNTTLGAAWQPGNCKFAVTIFKDNGALNVSEMQQGFQSGYILTGINQQGQEIPKSYKLEQNFPNPFNPVTNVHFSIPKDGIVSFKVYNALGQLVATYVDGFMKAGKYNAEIEGNNWASGIYFYTLSAKDFVETKKMILMK